MPKGPRGVAVIGQSGGPTAVINESLVGAVLESHKYAPHIEGFWGARHGVKGILKEDFVDLAHESRSRLEAVARTPSAGLGSVRQKPNREECQAILQVFKKNGIRYFFYIGGNDSAETAHIVKQMADEAGYDMRVAHIPKTIDNDLVGHDHCPGFPSAAKFVAQAFQGDDLDNRSLPGIKINVVMGRHAGFLTAAAALARTRPDDGPHLIYLPERRLSPEKLAADAKAMYKKHGRCLIAVSEGLTDESGQLYAERFVKDVDSHGNKQLSGTGALGDLLVDLLKKSFEADGQKIRARADTFGYLQRCFAGVRSETDAEEARWLGRWGVARAVLHGENGSMAMVRRPGDEYEVDLKVLPLESVAQKTRHFSDEWINEEGNDVLPGFLDYARPFVGELPKTARLSFLPVKR